MASTSLTRANDAESGSTRQWLALRLIGSGLLFATGAIHLDLYLTGYRTIPTIGWLFLLQVITAFGLGATILVSSSRLVAAAGAVFAIATLGGYLLSLRISLFGFREIRTTAGIVAGIIEVATFAVLAAFALRPFPEREPSVAGDSRRNGGSTPPTCTGRSVGSHRVHRADPGAVGPFAGGKWTQLYEHHVIEGSGRGQADPWRLRADECSWLYACIGSHPIRRASRPALAPVPPTGRR